MVKLLETVGKIVFAGESAVGKVTDILFDPCDIENHSFGVRIKQ